MAHILRGWILCQSNG